MAIVYAGRYLWLCSLFHVAAAFPPRLLDVLNGTRFVWGVKEKKEVMGRARK